MELTFNEKKYVESISNEDNLIFVADIGGTNSNFGILKMQNTIPILLVSFHAHSREIKDFSLLVHDVLEYIKNKYKKEFQKACFGAAGVISGDGNFVKPANLTFAIDVDVVKKATGLEEIFLINDFEAIGYGIEFLHSKDLYCINKGRDWQHSHKACLGAGTGLGKTIMIYDGQRKCYVPLASEGGHGDFSAQTHEEADLISFIKEEEGGRYHVSWEDVLSGDGIQHIYRFVSAQKTYPANEFDLIIEQKGYQPDYISYYRTKSIRCKHTFDLYSILYARCAKNLALDALSLAGVYIAGGIAAKNKEIFEQSTFMNEFIDCRKKGDLLKNIPIYLVLDYNVSLYGAAIYLSYKAS